MSDSLELMPSTARSQPAGLSAGQPQPSLRHSWSDHTQDDFTNFATWSSAGVTPRFV